MVGRNIKKYREEKKLTQDDLAQKLSVTRQTVSNWECGKTEPDIETLHKISEALEVAVEELIYGERRKIEIIHNHNVTKTVTEGGVSLGAVIAAVISYVKWQSIGWAILHGVFGWVYVIYYVIKYGWS